MSIAQNIATLRKAKGYTQEQLGELLGVSNQAVSKWESAVTCPDIMLLPKLADVLGVTLYDLYGIAEEPKDLIQRTNEFPSEIQDEIVSYTLKQMYIDSFKFTLSSDMTERGLITNIPAGKTLGVISYASGGAAFISNDLSLISSNYNLKNGGDILDKPEIVSAMKKICDPHVRRIWHYMYEKSFKDFPDEPIEYEKLIDFLCSYDGGFFDGYFSLQELSDACHLTEDETLEAVEKLISIQVMDGKQAPQYIFNKTKGVEVAVLLHVLERLIREPFAWGCGYLFGNCYYPK